MSIYNLNINEKLRFNIKLSNDIDIHEDKRDIYIIEVLKTYTGWLYTVINNYNDSFIMSEHILNNGNYIQDNVYNLELHNFKYFKSVKDEIPLSIMRVHNGWLYFNFNFYTYKLISFHFIPQEISTGIISGQTYTNSTPLPITHGGAIAGMTFNNMTMQEMFDLILYPYQEPAFIDFYINNISNEYEIGDSISINQTFIWNTSNDNNIKPNTIQISGDNLTTLTELTNDKTENIIFNSIITRNASDGPGTKNWHIQAENTKDNTFSRNYSIRFDYRMYIGNSSTTILNENQIESLNDYNSIHNGHNGTFTVSAGGYKFIAFADVYGAVNSFKDPDNGFDIDMYNGYSINENTWSYEIISVTNSFGETINYRLYRTTYELGSEQKITIA